jgi:Protein of unknown function (DUF2809)
MSSKLKFNRTYFILAMLLFGVEILIAKFAHDQIVRPYIGDLLVVILIYCFVRSFLDTAFLPTALSVLLFSYLVETAQYFNAINLLGLRDSRIARLIIGTSFAWMDILAYTVGIAFVIYFEKIIAIKKLKRK